MIVLDCNAALEICKGSEMGKALQALLVPEEEIVAPSLFSIEVTNAAWKHVHAGVLNQSQAKELMEDALALPDRFEATEGMLAEAYAEGVALDHSIYDMLYLVLTRRLGATLATCDKRLQECCEKRNIDCITEIEF